MFGSEAKSALVGEKFGLNEHGNIARKGDNQRLFKSDDPYRDAQELFEVLSDGATTVKPLESGKGLVARFTDGAVVTYRWATKTSERAAEMDSPAVQIDYSPYAQIANQKVHFEGR